MKKMCWFVLALVFVSLSIVLVNGELEAKEDIRVVLIGNQRFGDAGPMDNMADGLDRAASEFGVAAKKLESISAGAHEEDVMAMAREGYDLILTTFPPMSQAVIAAAHEFPETKFAAIYQFINVEGESIANIWDTEFHGQETLYMMGALAAKLSETKHLGIIAGAEEPFINNEMNGFLSGVRDVCADCEVDIAFVGSFEDPAKAKEIALAMISRGVDIMQTLAAKSQLGVLEAAKEQGKLFLGDVADNYDKAPEAFVGFYGVDFGANVVEAVRMLVEDNWQGGKPGVMNTANGGYFVPWDVIERFGAASGTWSDKVSEAVEVVRGIEQKIVAGELKVPFNPELPTWK